jgi:hypothetical protein
MNLLYNNATSIKTLYIIASFRNEVESIEYFCKKIDETFLEYNDIDYRIYFINDYSTDNSENLIIDLKKKNKKIFLISLKKNYGGSNSIHHGFDIIPDDQFATVIDCDLQDPPEVLAREFNSIDTDTLVNFVRLGREEGFFQLLYTDLAYRFIGFVSNNKIIKNSNYFKIIPSKVIKKIKQSDEIYPYWNYFISSLSNKNKIVYYKRSSRNYGESKFNIFSANPWITFYSALYYFKIKSYLIFFFLIFINYLSLIKFKSLLIIDFILALSLLLQIINIFFFTVCNFVKYFKKRPKIKIDFHNDGI